MKAVAVFFVVSLLIASIANAEPLEFRGIKMGASYEEVKALLENKAFDKEGILERCGRDLCIQKNKIKGIPVEVLYSFDDTPAGAARLTSIYINFLSEYYGLLRHALMTKYKKPSFQKKNAVQNHMGATFLNEIAQWDMPSGMVRIEKYGYKIDKGFVAIESKEFLEKIDKQVKDDAVAPGF